MRILRLRLRNYRGTAEREVEFAPDGVTVVAGPNEIGKSSLAEAIDLLFDELDSTTKQRVRDVQPVHRDAGAEIEADVETGPYAFTYAKRFQRKAETRLSVTRPKVENRTGREAHQRVREILDETIDTDLWRALRVQQGEGLEQASWLGRPGLSAALDRAAGAGAAVREESLFDAAEQECARYFTKTGRERSELTRAASDALHARRHEDATRQELALLEGDIARAEELRSLRAAHEHQARAAEAFLREQERSFEPIAALREALVTARAKQSAAQAEEREAASLARERSRIVTSHAAAEADVAQRSEEIVAGEPSLLGARAELENAERSLREAREALDAATRRSDDQRRDLEFHRTVRELSLLRERSERILAARRGVEEAETLLAARPLDAGAVREIRDAELAVDRARTRVETEGPLVRLTPTAPLQAVLDGRSLSLEAGETLERRVAESLQLSVPELADLLVVAGAGAAERVKLLEQAQTRWRQRCAEHGVQDHADAVRSFAARTESLRRLAEHRRLLGELLGEPTGSPLAERRLAERIEGLEKRARQFDAERSTLFPLTSTAEEAEQQLAASDLEQQRAQEGFRAAERRRDALVERHRQLAEQHRETAVRLELAQQSLQDLTQRLTHARAEASDDDVRHALEQRETRAHEVEAAASDAAQRLEALRPEEVEARLEGARRDRERWARELAAVRDEANQVAARLEVRGEAGLYERLETACAEVDRTSRHERSLRRRAAAARRLLDTLREERDATRDGYADPLARRIEELGRHVFGSDFSVELDEELRVARRIQHGLSLAFDQLSAGAREQIALLARLAVATLVAEDGGAPLIVDDALGHSDPERLVRIGRALSHAAPGCQILVLTCTPERYRHVESARVVQLA